VNLSPTIDAALSNLHSIAMGENNVMASVLVDFLSTDKPVFDEIRRVAQADRNNPYGRRVLLETEALEVMVACWTPGHPCAPHDHGGSVGAVRVLQGRALHTTWSRVDDRLLPVRVEGVDAGCTMQCDADMIHSMQDDGAELPLITLHMYTKSIDHMIVYDIVNHETLVVEGSFGAWVPHEQPQMIRSRYSGIRRPDAIR
jgi:predicted metal-dependent enzyme (double-stranded beta helix superfamily)